MAEETCADQSCSRPLPAVPAPARPVIQIKGRVRLISSSHQTLRELRRFTMTAASFYSISEHAQPIKAVKRKWEDETEKSCSVISHHDQIVPNMSPEKRRRTKFPFSNLMRDMASRYQQPGAMEGLYNPLVMSLLAPMTNPYSRLMAAMANMSSQHSVTTFAPAPASPLDLSNSSDDNEIDVTTTDTEEEEDMEAWSPRRVGAFIRGIEGCEDLAPVFESESVTGAQLSRLSVPQLVRGLGVPVSRALRIVSIVRAK